MTIALDGSNHANASGAVASITLTTTQANDVIIISALSNQGTATAQVLSAVSSTNTTGWTLLATTFQSAVPTQPIDLWWGKATAPLSGEVITLTFNGSPGFSTVDAYGISGAAIASPIDPSGATAGSTNHVDNTVTTTGSGSQWMLIANYRFGATPIPTAGGGWTAISGADYLLDEYQIVSTTRSAADVPIGTGTGDNNSGIAVGILAAAGSFGASLAESASAADVVAATASAVSLSEVASAHETLGVSGGGGMRANTLLWGLVPGWQP